MDLNNLPTAEEFLSLGLDESGFTLTKSEVKIYSSKLKSFAKMHVKAALKAATEKAIAKQNHSDYGSGEIWVDEKSILTAYPETLIK